MEDMAVMKNVLKDLEVELKTKGRFFGAKQLHCQQMRIIFAKKENKYCSARQPKRTFKKIVSLQANKNSSKKILQANLKHYYSSGANFCCC